MKPGATVMGLDVATAYGWTIGPAGGEPSFGHGVFKVSEATDEAVNWAALKWANDFFTLYNPNALFVEEPILIVNRGPNRRPENGKTLKRLWGLSSVVRAVAYGRGVYRQEVVTADAVRRHFIGMKKALPGDEAKRQVQERCRELGWAFKTPDEADSLALWDYGVEQVQPGAGHPWERRLFPTGALPKVIRPQERMSARDAHNLLFKKGKLK